MIRAVVYDGYCHVCSGSVRFLLKHPVEPPFEYVPMESEWGRELLVAHEIDPKDPTTFLVLDENGAWTESEGIMRVMQAMGGFWQYLAACGRLVPKPLRNWLYRVLARNRYDWFGKRSVCYLPDSGDSSPVS